MTMLLKPTLGVALALAFGTAASAQDVGETTVAAGLSTFGLNLEASHQFYPELRIRGVLMGVPGVDALNDTVEEDGTTFSYDASIAALAAMVDYYPTSTGFRVSGGLVLHQSDAVANAQLSASNAFTLDDGTTFTTGSATLKTEFEKKISPMISAGYDYRFADNWVVSGELGAIYTGGVSLEASASDPALQAEINADADIRQAREDAKDLTFYPYVSITVGYRF